MDENSDNLQKLLNLMTEMPPVNLGGKLQIQYAITKWYKNCWFYEVIPLTVRGQSLRVGCDLFCEIKNSTSYSEYSFKRYLVSRATPHLSVKRERPLMTAYSFYFKIVMHYYSYQKHVREGEWRRSSQIWHHLIYKGYLEFCVQRKANFSFGRLWTLLGVLESLV